MKSFRRQLVWVVLAALQLVLPLRADLGCFLVAHDEGCCCVEEAVEAQVAPRCCAAETLETVRSDAAGAPLAEDPCGCRFEDDEAPEVPLAPQSSGPGPSLRASALELPPTRVLDVASPASEPVRVAWLPPRERRRSLAILFGVFRL